MFLEPSNGLFDPRALVVNGAIFLAFEYTKSKLKSDKE